jgi:hypothetical protein
VVLVVADPSIGGQGNKEKIEGEKGLPGIAEFYSAAGGVGRKDKSAIPGR